MKIWTGFCLIILGSLIAGCGADSTTASSSADDVPGTALATLDESIEALSEDSSNSSSRALEATNTSAKSSFLAKSDADFTVARTCTASGGVATVSETWSGTWSKTNSRTKVTVEMSAKASGTQSRVWTPPTGQSLSCHTTNNRANIDWSSEGVVNGLKLAIDTDRTRTRTMSITTTKKSKSKTIESTAKGTRTITWATGTSTSTTVTRNKTISSSIARTMNKTEDGVSTTKSVTVATKSGADLSVDVVRLKADGSLVTKTIKAGTLVATFADTSRVETTFENVVIDMTQDDPCTPTSGTITGSVYAVDATEATSTFTIKFGQDTDSTISYEATGTTAEDGADFAIQGCDLASEN
jgi:hypothetical protein